MDTTVNAKGNPLLIWKRKLKDINLFSRKLTLGTIKQIPYLFHYKCPNEQPVSALHVLILKEWNLIVLR